MVERINWGAEVQALQRGNGGSRQTGATRLLSMWPMRRGGYECEDIAAEGVVVLIHIASGNMGEIALLKHGGNDYADVAGN